MLNINAQDWNRVIKTKKKFIAAKEYQLKQNTENPEVKEAVTIKAMRKIVYTTVEKELNSKEKRNRDWVKKDSASNSIL